MFRGHVIHTNIMSFCHFLQPKFISLQSCCDVTLKCTAYSFLTKAIISQLLRRYRNHFTRMRDEWWLGNPKINNNSTYKICEKRREWVSLSVYAIILWWSTSGMKRWNKYMQSHILCTLVSSIFFNMSIIEST